MRYSVHLTFGQDFEKSAHSLKTYMLKYGEKNEPYFNIYSLLEDENNINISEIIATPENKNIFISGLENKYEVESKVECEFSKENADDFISDFFIRLFKNINTINQLSDTRSLHLCLHIPLYKKEVWTTAKKIVDAIANLSLEYKVDIIAITSDLATIFEKEEEKEKLPLRRKEYNAITTQTLNEIVKYKRKNLGFINNVVVIQDTRIDGLALNLDIESYTRIIGEFSILCIEHYNSVFIPVSLNSPIKTFGLAALHFDSYYFVQYLLSRSYLYIMERENITQEKVDIVKVSNLADEILRKRINFFSKFYTDEVVPLINQKTNENKIVEIITPKLDVLFNTMANEFQSYLSNENWTLPEKKVILAAILGIDDALFSGYEYNQDQPVIEDLDDETANIFINENNEILSYAKQSQDEDKERELLSYAALSSDDPAYLPLNEIKKIRAKIRQSITYIRKQEEILETISKQKRDNEESQKRLTDDGYFIFEGNKYRLLPKDIEEQFLAETYIPKSDIEKNIDLRNGFTRVKNQGKQSSCTAFTFTSIYEYILKINHAEEYNLSEAFLYYNTRKKSEKENVDSGSSLYDSIWALGQSGICTEQMFPYNENIFDLEPPETAYISALERVVKKAVNVKANKKDIRSALSDGYPIAASFKIYNSFSTDKAGFISRPTEQELTSGEYGNHAMVICGYSDEQKVFIVRNSWGDSFGDNGYCYIPYSYIEDNRLINMACIVTEVGSGYHANSEKNQKAQLNFNLKDDNIRHSILKNLIEEEKYYLSYLESKDSRYRYEYLSLISKLNNNNLRSQLITGTIKRLQYEAADLDVKKRTAQEEKAVDLMLFKKETRKTGFIVSVIAVSIWTIIGFSVYYLNMKAVFSSRPVWILLFISFLLVGLLFLYFPIRKRKKKIREREWNDLIINLAARADAKRKQASTTRLKMHIAGMAFDRLYDLQSRLKDKYHVMSSFIGNLLTWNTEESKKINNLDPCTKDPFIPLLDNKVLDEYFENNKKDIAKDLRLYNFIISYEISEQGIREFKQELKEDIIKSLYDLISDFKIYNHVAGISDYKYLDKEHTDFMLQLTQLDKKSLVFVQIAKSAHIEGSHNVVFIKTDTQEEKKNWATIYPRAFSAKPCSENLSSPTKLIILRVLDLELEQLMIGG